MAKQKWHPEYDSKGSMKFEVIGTLQEVKDDPKHECDYLTFYIDTEDVDDNISTISLTNSYENDIIFKVGYKFKLKGNIRSLWCKDIKRLIYWFDVKEFEEL